MIQHIAHAYPMRIFDPFNFNADAPEEFRNYIYFFHFIKSQRNQKGLILFENNSNLIPKKTIQLLTLTCLEAIDALRATKSSPLFKRISGNIKETDDISDDASTTYDESFSDSSSNTDSTSSIYDETEFE